jgi:preprotein translocase subunit SecG
MDILNILKYVAAASSVGLIITILLQAPRSGGLGVALGGGGGGGEAYRSKRGIEALLFNLTIVFIIVLVASAMGIAIISI